MNLRLSLKLNNYRVAKEELPEATVSLVNEGKEPVVVNARLLLAPVGYANGLHEISFFIKGPEGSVNLTRFSVNAGPPKQEDFVRLLPGEFIFQIYELSKYFYYETPGKYIITTEYTNDTQIVKFERRSWIGKLKSNEQIFEITQ